MMPGEILGSDEFLQEGNEVPIKIWITFFHTPDGIRKRRSNRKVSARLNQGQIRAKLVLSNLADKTVSGFSKTKRDKSLNESLVEEN